MASSLAVEVDPPPPPAPDPDTRSVGRPAAVRKRRLRERISLGHLFMIAAALLAFVLVVSLLQDRSVTTQVIVAESDIFPGTVLTPDLVTEIELPADSPLVGSVATIDQIAGGGVAAAQRIAAGEPITMTAIAPASSPSTLRAMSLPIDRVEAVGGDLVAGDRIDIIAVDDGNAAYVAVGLEVLAAQNLENRPGALGTSSLSRYFVTVGIDDQTALAVVGAMDIGQVILLRSTGAEPVPLDERMLRTDLADPLATLAPTPDEPTGTADDATGTDG